MKNCICCKNLLPREEFYRHPRMGDGTLNKCKSCCKTQAEERRLKKLSDLSWVEMELDRQRKKSEKYRKEGRVSKFVEDGRKRWEIRNKHKKYAHGAVSNAIKSGKLIKQNCCICDSVESEAHHEDYTKPLDVVWYCKRHHNDRHNEIRRIERMKKLQEKTPPPGSPEAEELGCKCPVLDNAHGHGYMGQQGIYVYNAACELHASRPDIDDDWNEPLGTPACNLDGECESCQ